MTSKLSATAGVVADKWNAEAPGPPRRVRYTSLTESAPDLRSSDTTGAAVVIQRQIVREHLVPRRERLGKAPKTLRTPVAYATGLPKRRAEYPLVATQRDLAAVGPLGRETCSHCAGGRRACPPRVACPVTIEQESTAQIVCQACQGRGFSSRRICLDCAGVGIYESTCLACKGIPYPGKGVKCSICAGRGIKREYCAACKGHKEVGIVCTACQGARRLAQRQRRKVTCPTCAGQGSKPCPVCSGRGSVTCDSCGGDGAFATWRSVSREYLVEPVSADVDVDPDWALGTGLPSSPEKLDLDVRRRVIVGSRLAIGDAVGQIRGESDSAARLVRARLEAEAFGRGVEAVVVDVYPIEATRIEGTLPDGSKLSLGGWRYKDAARAAAFEVRFGVPPVDPQRAARAHGRDRLIFLAGALVVAPLVVLAGFLWRLAPGPIGLIDLVVVLGLATLAGSTVWRSGPLDELLDSFGSGFAIYWRKRASPAVDRTTTSEPSDTAS